MIDPFMGPREAEKRGGAGTRSDMGDGDSGNRGAAGSTNVRTNSEGEMGEDCKAVW